MQITCYSTALRQELGLVLQTLHEAAATPGFTTRRDEHKCVCVSKGFEITQCSRSELVHKSGDPFFTLSSCLPLKYSEEEPKSIPGEGLPYFYRGHLFYFLN